MSISASVSIGSNPGISFMDRMQGLGEQLNAMKARMTELDKKGGWGKLSETEKTEYLALLSNIQSLQQLMSTERQTQSSSTR
jgi:hypothetical protein